METHYILALMQSPGVGRKTVLKIIDSMKVEPTDIKELHDLIVEAKQIHKRIKVPSIEELKRACSTADSTIAEAEKMDINIVGLRDSNFPSRLKSISDPPVVIYVKGNANCLNSEQLVAVIGTRKPSKHGRNMAESFGTALAEKSIIVVSGLAIGCDTAAHQGCLKVNGKTVAVLANGLDTVYPKQNIVLAEKILENSGCLLSEYPPGEKIRNSYFVDRDRLQSGLSDAVIVVETDIKGGSMHTVKYCIEHNRLLVALEHPEKAELFTASGNTKILNEGKAMPIKDLKDIEALITKLSSTLNVKTAEIESGVEYNGTQLSMFDN